MGSVKDLIEIFGGLGPAAPVIALLVWLWWQERGERRDLSKYMMKLTADQIEAEKEITTAITILTAKVAK